MKDSEIEKLITNNDDDKLKFYLSNALEKSKSIEKESKQLGLVMILLIALKYLVDTSKDASLSYFGLAIKELAIIKNFIPLVFAFVLLRYLAISLHKQSLSKIIKLVSFKLFDHSDEGDIHSLNLLRSIMPLSIYGEINRAFLINGGCFGLVLALPIIILVLFVPLAFECVWLWDLFLNFWSVDLYV
ncbi:MAG: hypothetical protein HRT69_17025, partial [Flavobacteriaceae bacterium]|nr:hypothetical protein [Flavobacteriaceae bacterium]